MTVFFEYIRDQDHYVRSILSDVNPMKTLTAEQHLKHDAATTSEKRRNITAISTDFTSVRIAIRAI